MSTISRRSLVTSAAALLAQPDPIIAAIAEHDRLKKEWESLSSQLDEAEGKVKGLIPVQLIIWRNHMIGGSEIERMRDQLLAKPRANQKKIEREYQKAKASLRAKKVARREWYKRNGLTELKAAGERASKAKHNALMSLTTVRPTTVAGAGALIAYIRRDMEIGEHPWQPKALANAARALMNMPEQALPEFPPEAKGLDLSNAICDMHNFDDAIDRLHKKYGDDADGRNDYQQLLIEREEVLGTLGAMKAKSSNGMVAKADALVDHRVIEDNDVHEKIATSLATDVLRYFGHAM